MGATVIDGRGGGTISDGVVVIDAGLVVAAGARADTPVPATSDLIDVPCLFLLPGLIDAHVHVGGTRTPNPMLQERDDAALRVARSVADLGWALQIEAAHLAEAIQYRQRVTTCATAQARPRAPGP